MTNGQLTEGLERFLSRVRMRINLEAPDLTATLEDYIGEARFGYEWLAEDLAKLDLGACILEIGAGTHLLSCALVDMGFKVISVEPVGEGFSHFNRLKELVLQVARDDQHLPQTVSTPAESLEFGPVADFAFSINVMEHVSDVESALNSVFRALKAGGLGYRFVCPNYVFPYEPHFNIPTLISKSITARVLGRWIWKSGRVIDPRGTWDSLNWISVPQIRAYKNKFSGGQIDFSKAAWRLQISRVFSDQRFQARRGALLRAAFWMVRKFRLSAALSSLPVSLSPVMDCRLKKLGEST